MNNIDYIIRTNLFLSNLTKAVNCNNMRKYNINKKYDFYHLKNDYKYKVYIIHNKQDNSIQYLNNSNNIDINNLLTELNINQSKIIKIQNTKDIEIKLKQIFTKNNCDESVKIKHDNITLKKLFWLKLLESDFKSKKEKENNKLYYGFNKLVENIYR